MRHASAWKTAVAAAAMVFLGASGASAYPSVQEGPSAGEMMADVVFVRPFGVLATVVGTGFFVVSLPFTLLAGDVAHAADELVLAPFLYTFSRPLGDEEAPR